jgi:hypothetical protein
MLRRDDPWRGPTGCTWSLMRQGERVANPAEDLASRQAFNREITMSLSPAEDQRYYDHVSIDELEQQLLALGPMPRRGAEPWDPTHWSRYAEVVRTLVAQITWSSSDQEESAPSA